MRKRIFSLILIFALALTAAVFPSEQTYAAKKKNVTVTSQKGYWRALYKFSKGGYDKMKVDVSALGKEGLDDLESPSGWKYYADIGYVITQDFDYRILRDVEAPVVSYVPYVRGTMQSVTFSWMTKADKNRAVKVRRKANAIEKKIIKKGMTKRKKVYAVANYIEKNVRYIYDPSNADVNHQSDSFGALVKGKAACQGNAAAFNLLARKAGVHSVMVTNRKENHAWNMVKIGKNYYMIDVTMPNRMGKLTKLSNVKGSMYRNFDQKKYYKKLFKYEKMVKY